MFRKYLAAVGSLALMLSSAQAQSAAPGPAVQPPVLRDADPALWVVRDKDTTIYLFGTVHTLKPGLSWFDEAVRQAFDKSDTVVLEIIEPEPDVQASVVRRLARNSGGPTVTSLLPEDRRAAYAAAMRDAGMPATALDGFDPWFPTVYLSVATLPKYGYDANQGADKIIARAAKEAEKSIVGLETLEQQLGFFDTLPQEVQVRYLVIALDTLGETGTILDKVVDRWGAGDPDGLVEVMNESMREVPEVAKALLSDRNARWAGWIEERLDTPGVVFLAVGAGHLAGRDSVQAYLKKRKLRVTRVTY